MDGWCFLFQLWMVSIVFEVNKSFMSCPPSKISCRQMVQPAMLSLVIGSWIGRIFSKKDTTSNGFCRGNKSVKMSWLLIFLYHTEVKTTTINYQPLKHFLMVHNFEAFCRSKHECLVIMAKCEETRRTSKHWNHCHVNAVPCRAIEIHWMALPLWNQLGQQWSHPSNWSGAHQILSMGLKPMSLASADQCDFSNENQDLKFTCILRHWTNILAFLIHGKSKKKYKIEYDLNLNHPDIEENLWIKSISQQTYGWWKKCCTTWDGAKTF